MLLYLTAALSSAHATEPEVVVEGGAVVAHAIVQAPAAEALALLRDPERNHAVSGEPDSELKATPDGDCYDVTYHQAHPVASVSYTARSCNTPSGVKTELVQSDTFHSMQSEWTVEETEAGTELTFRYEADVAMPVPKWMVLRSTRKAIARSVGKLVKHLDD